MAPLPRAVVFSGLLITALAVGLRGGHSDVAIAGQSKAFTAAGEGHRLVYGLATGYGPHDAQHVHVINADGSGHKALTKGPHVRHYKVAAAPDGRWISFEREPPDGRTVNVIKPDGSGITRLLPGGSGVVGSPDRPWAPDGKTLLVHEGLGTVVTLHIVNPDTGEVRRLPRAAVGADPAWSPDGRRLAGLRFDRGEVSALAVLNIVSGRRVVLARPRGPEGRIGWPTWLHGGRRLVFKRWDLDHVTDGLWIVNAGGGGERRLIKGRIEANERFPVLSPAADKIAFTTVGTDGAIRIEVVKADGTGRRVLFRQPKAPLGRRSHCCLQPAWSPDGRKIAYLRDRMRPQRKEVWIMNADGTGKKRLTRRGFADYLTWLPGG